DSEATGVTRADSHRNGGDLVLALDERAAIFGQFPAQSLHNVRPGRDGIARAETDARGDQPQGQGFIAGHDDLMAGLALALDELEGFEDVSQRMTIAGMKRGQGVVEHARVLAAK